MAGLKTGHQPPIRCVDFIGDIHGQASVLRNLLSRMGYREKNGRFQNPDRHTVFLGDVVNRGPEIREACLLVQKMVQSGNATFLLGNHELFALWEEEARLAGLPSSILPKKAKAHLESTRQSFFKNAAEWRKWLVWLRQQPLFFAGPGVRGVHACWDDAAIAVLRNNRLQPGDLLQPASPRFRAAWQLAEGPSLIGPVKGKKFRIRWWVSHAANWREIAYPAKKNLPARPLPLLRLAKTVPYPGNAPPLFFGHYGFPKPCQPITPNLACLDLAVAQGGPIGAYRWEGEKTILPSHFWSQIS